LRDRGKQVVDIILGLPTLILRFIVWVGERIARGLVGWWLGKVLGYVAKSIMISDREVCLVGGVDPLRLRVRFRISNGSASVVRLRSIVVYLYCGGALVGSVVGDTSNNPLVSPNGVNVRIRRGESIDVSVEITPSIYLWFWLLPSSNYDLVSSSVVLDTVWGRITKFLDGRTNNRVIGSKVLIDSFIDRVRGVIK
jgi:hypothetical protein